jgi:hypothetical protein
MLNFITTYQKKVRMNRQIELSQFPLPLFSVPIKVTFDARDVAQWRMSA